LRIEYRDDFGIPVAIAISAIDFLFNARDRASRMCLSTAAQLASIFSADRDDSAIPVSCAISCSDLPLNARERAEGMPVSSAPTQSTITFSSAERITHTQREGASVSRTEVLTWSQLGLHAKPCGVLNVLGFYTPLLTMFDHAVEERFLKPENRALVLARESPADLLRALEEWRPVHIAKWLDRETSDSGLRAQTTAHDCSFHTQPY
jgi:hypothetical protein